MKLCTQTDYSELDKIRHFIITNAKSIGMLEDEAAKIALAVDEACSNLIRHAFNLDKSHEICINMSYQNNVITVDILDDGLPFNPLDVPMQNMNEYFGKFQKGGLGIHIIKKIMDEIDYIPSSKHNPKNTLKLKKILN